MNHDKRYVYILSDGTGITAESLANSLMSQFEQIEFEKQIIPYLDTLEKAQAIVSQINACAQKFNSRPLVFTTLINQDINACVKNSSGHVFDLFSTFLAPMEKELNATSSYTIGKTHGVADINAYTQRIEAINYTLEHDDGVKIREYDKADIILIGVSRCGKTPSCLYMALQFGILAANYPFTDEDLTYFKLPDTLRPFKRKLFGLTIDANRLKSIRNERRPNSQYASSEQCRIEVAEVEAMYQRESIPYLNSTHFSIEEIATKIMNEAHLKRRI